MTMSVDSALKRTDPNLSVSVKLSLGRQQVLDFLGRQTGPTAAGTIALALCKPEGTIASLLHRMVRDRQVVKLGWGAYALTHSPSARVQRMQRSHGLEAQLGSFVVDILHSLHPRTAAGH